VAVDAWMVVMRPIILIDEQTFNNGEVIIDNLSQWGKTIGSA